MDNFRMDNGERLNLKLRRFSILKFSSTNYGLLKK
jgi:hypothetical protein